MLNKIGEFLGISILSIYLVFWILFLFAIIYFGYKKLTSENKEDFEDRKN